MKRAVKIISYIGIAIVSVAILLVVIGVTLEDKLVSYTVNYVRASSPMPLKIGSAKVSLFKNFPNASVILKNVAISSSSSAGNEYIELSELQISFGLLGVFSNKFNINNVVLKDGRVKIKMNRNGSELINPFLQSESASEKTNWLVSIGSLSLQNIELAFSNSATNWNVNTLIKKAVVKGIVEPNGYSFDIKFKAHIGLFAQGEFIYLVNSNVDVSTNFKSKNNFYTAQNGLLTIDGVTLNFSTKIGQTSGLPIKIAANGSNIDTETLLRILTQQRVSLPDKTSTYGNISFRANISGIVGSSAPFDIDIKFDTKRFVVLLNSDLNITIESLTGEFLSNANGQASIDTKFQKIRFNDSFISGKLKAKNFVSPILFFSGETSVNISDIHSLRDSLPEMEGLLNGNIEFLLEIKDPLSPSLSDLKSLKAFGNLSLSNFSLSFNDRDLKLSSLSGNATLNNQLLENFLFKGNLNNSAINGEILRCNIVSFIAKTEPLNITASISIDEFNTECLAANDSKNIESKNDYEIGAISGPISVNTLKHKKFTSKFVSANATLYSNRYVFDNLKGATCSGVYNGRLAIDTDLANKQKIVGEIDAKGIEISTLFNSFDSFGQSLVTDKNISGKFSGTTFFVSNLNNWNFDLSTLQLSSTVSIINGKLEGIKQLEGLSKFISLEELRSISFMKLENTIQVEKGEITIPKMEVKSSVMDFICSGSQNINGTYSYRVALNLGDILFRKASKNNSKNTAFGEIEPDGTGKTKLYLKIDDFGQGINVSYDHQASREGLKISIKSEKESIKQAFRDEFGSIFKTKKDSNNVIIKPKAKFELEWGDSTKRKEKDSTTTVLQKKKDDSKKTKFEIDWDDN